MKRTIAALAALVLAAGMTGCSNSAVTIHGTKYDLNTTSLSLTSDPSDSLDQLTQLPKLESLDLSKATLEPAAYEALQKALPGTAISWNVPICGTSFPSDSTQITLSSLSDADVNAVQYFHQLTAIEVTGYQEPTMIQRLVDQYPNVKVIYSIPLGGKECSPADTCIAPVGVSTQDLRTWIPLFSQLEQVDLRQSGLSKEEALVLAGEFPQIRFLQTVRIGGQDVDPTAEELEFTGPGIPIDEIEAALPFCPNLKKVVLLDSELPLETLDALNKKYPDVQIVWNMHVGLVPVRTDDKFFAPITYGFTKVWGDAEFEKLNYMTEVECVDLGHNEVHNIDWVKNMPKLKYLILADTPITNIDALAGHPSLIYLEIFSTAVNDYTPLTTCLKLEDINISRTRGDPEPLSKMTWLKNIWWGDNLDEINMTEQNQINRKKAEELLPKALPNTNVMIFLGAPTLKGWRDLPNYFAMRDCLGMFYMQGSTD